MVATLRTRLSRAKRQRRCFSLRSEARSVVGLAGRSRARGLPSSRCPSVREHTGSRSAQTCQRTPPQPSRARPTAVSRSKHCAADSADFNREANPTNRQDAHVVAHSSFSIGGFLLPMFLRPVVRICGWFPAACSCSWRRLTGRSTGVCCRNDSCPPLNHFR